MLSQLEQRALTKSVERSEAENRKRTAGMLKDKIFKLRQRKAALEKQLSEPLPLLTDADIILKKLDEMKWMYALLGMSVSVLSPDSVLVKLSTSHRGLYLQTFSMQLKLEDGSFKLVHHDVPSTIEMSTLSLLLESNLPEFFTAVHGQIRAYLSREEEIKYATDVLKGYMIGNIACPYPHNNISFILKSHSTFEPRQFYINLYFNDNLLVLPSDVMFDMPQTLMEEERRAISVLWKNSLRTQLLGEAAYALVKTLDDLSSECPTEHTE